MKYYLAYGSNLNLTQMFHRCPHARVIGHTSLSDMRLVFRGSKTGSYLTVEPDEAASVPCGVFAIQDDDELALDHYEGYPVFYQKQTLHVPEVMAVGTKEVVLRDIDAMIYTMPTDHRLGFPLRTTGRSASRATVIFTLPCAIWKRPYLTAARGWRKL